MCIHLSPCDRLRKKIDSIVKMFRRSSFFVFCLFLTILATIGAEEAAWDFGNLVKKEQRTTLVSTEYGEISAARVSDNVNGSYLLHFFILEPNSLFLPVLLHADMVFYVHTGSGKLSWTEEDDLKSTELLRGDVYALRQGSVFFVQSNLETTESERRKLRIHAIFVNSKGPITRPYASIREMVLGFDRKVLQAAFRVSEEVMDELLGGTRQPAIIHAVQETRGTAWEVESQFVRNLLGSRSYNIFETNKKKKGKGAKAYNLFKEHRDFENCNGWSTTVTRKKLSALKGINFGVFMVNLTIGSMMGPHWNPRATEVAVVLQGHGMVRTVCSSISNETTCRNMRFEVGEGDVFLVPRFHPMAQMAFNNETFVFMGFSTSVQKNHPQFLAGQASVLRTLDKDVLAMSFDATNTSLDELLAAQHDSVILGCTSCAEEEFRIMEEEIEREGEEERQRQEEEARQREEERRREEEEERKEEEARRKEEEKKRQEEEEERREEEEARQREEERRREEEEEARRKEEEKRRQEEEEERRTEEEEAGRGGEEAARREEEERRQQEEKERQTEEEEVARKKEEEKRRQEEEEEEARQREEEEAGRREEEAARREEEDRRRQEEEERRREQEEEAQRREQEEEEARQREQEQEEARWREEEQAAEEERRMAEKAQREEEAARQQERERERRQEEGQRREQEEEARWREQEEEEGGQRGEEEAAAEQERRREEAAQREEEAARQQERERERERDNNQKKRKKAQVT